MENRVGRRDFLKGLVKVVGGVVTGGLVGGCGIVVDEIVRSNVRKRIDPRQINVHVNGGTGGFGKGVLPAPYDIKLLAYYRIRDLGTGEIEIVEGRYGGLTYDWENKYHKIYRNKCTDGSMTEFIENGNIITIIRMPKTKDSD